VATVVLHVSSGKDPGGFLPPAPGPETSPPRGCPYHLPARPDGIHIMYDTLMTSGTGSTHHFPEGKPTCRVQGTCLVRARPSCGLHIFGMRFDQEAPLGIRLATRKDPG